MDLLFLPQATDPRQRQIDRGNRQRPPNTVEMGGIISSSETLVNILLGSRATDTVEVVVVGDCQGYAESETAVPSAFGDPKKLFSVGINLSKSP